MTKDSSPTLRLNGNHPLDQTKSAESMHHSGGAATETLYIYGEALRWALRQAPVSELHVCSVGLGLGYNEILFAILVLLNTAKTAKVDSFEIDSELQESFLKWVFENESQKNKNDIYDQIFNVLVEKLNVAISVLSVKKYLQIQYHSGSWRLFNELNQQKIPHNSKYHVCLFDAFSQKTTGELWDENFLNQFLQSCFHSQFAMLSTYACTGVLTRALKNHGFTVTKRPGFQGKRDSTWAERVQL